MMAVRPSARCSASRRVWPPARSTVLSARTCAGCRSACSASARGRPPTSAPPARWLRWASPIPVRGPRIRGSPTSSRTSAYGLATAAAFEAFRRRR